MKLKEILICLVVIFQCSYALHGTQDTIYSLVADLVESMEYHIYLKEVIQALERDPDFIKRLHKANGDDVWSGKFADQLAFVNHNVKTELNEIKRRELDRLRHRATKQLELINEFDINQSREPLNEHLDVANPNTFEIEDLKKLIKKTTSNLDSASKSERKPQTPTKFQEYEMQKEFERRQKIKQEENSKKYHRPIFYPSSQQQLEEVWEKPDHMDQVYDPKLFFIKYDVDGNGEWDQDEVMALLTEELGKLNGPGGPRVDLHERAEEMERMRKQVFKANDKLYQDGLIDFIEYTLEAERAELTQDDGWKPIDENQNYTQAQYKEFETKQIEKLRSLQRSHLGKAHGGVISVRRINNRHSLGNSKAANSIRTIRKDKNHSNTHQEFKFRHQGTKDISNTRRDNPHTSRRNSKRNHNIRISNRSLKDNFKVRINRRKDSIKVGNSPSTTSGAESA